MQKRGKMKLKKVSVKNVRQPTGEAYYADVIVTDLLTDCVESLSVRTNKHGEGFWIDDGHEDSQCAGTMQFQATSLNSFRAKVRRWFSDGAEI